MAVHCEYFDTVFTTTDRFDRSDLSTCHLSNITFKSIPLRYTSFEGGVLYFNVTFLSCDMTGANLSGASFEDGVSFTDSTLDGANLLGASHDGELIPCEKLVAEARSLKGAIMPNGSVHP